MFNGAHVLFYSRDPEADRAFFSDVLELRSVDAGHGWLIFALPPAEAALHPIEDDDSPGQKHAGHQLLGAVVYLMCEDLQATVQALAAKNVVCTEIDQAPWGLKTTIPLPSGGELGLYQPRHPTALGL
ncbi:MAG TPA: VOC family protein [Thermoanaerobaculia bacterium]|jgi:catechol 2,3-dioxygenase-like lactoylglutathione lyase family enzyme|nr:VOC family protein [Thermoanaerobaculia bacterium]